VLHDRLRSVLDDGGWPDVTRFDPDDEVQFDAVARRLLERFARQRDAEAFALLMQLTRGRLLDMATRLATGLGCEIAPGTLVEAVLARVFNDPSPAAAAGFFAEARDQMGRLAREAATRSNGHVGPAGGLPGHTSTAAHE
jgi:hypothetical protein